MIDNLIMNWKFIFDQFKGYRGSNSDFLNWKFIIDRFKENRTLKNQCPLQASALNYIDEAHQLLIVHSSHLRSSTNSASRIRCNCVSISHCIRKQNITEYRLRNLALSLVKGRREATKEGGLIRDDFFLLLSLSNCTVSTATGDRREAETTMIP